MGRAKVHRFEVEIVSTLPPDLIDRTVRASSNGITHYLRLVEQSDPAIRVRVTRLARRAVYDERPADPEVRV